MYSQFSKALKKDDPDNQEKPPMVPGTHIPVSKDAKPGLQDDQLIEKAMFADNFIEHGLIQVDKSVSIFGEILNLSEGRDKIFKIFSSLLKICRYFLERTTMISALRQKDYLARIKTASSSTSIARAFLKLFTDWVFFRMAIRIYYKQRFGLLKVLSMGRLVGLGLYFTFQLPVWLHTTQLNPAIKRDLWAKLSLKAYIVSTVCQILMDIQKLRTLTQDIGYIRFFATRPAPPSPPSPGFADGFPEHLRGDGPSSSQLQPSALRRYMTAVHSHSHAGSQDPADGASAAPASSALLLSAYARGADSARPPPTAGSSRPGGRSRARNSLGLGAGAGEHSEDDSEAEPLADGPGDNPVQPAGGPFRSLPAGEVRRKLSVMRSRADASPGPSAVYAAAVEAGRCTHAQADDKVAELRKGRNDLCVNFIKDGGDLLGAVHGVWDLGLDDLSSGLLGVVSGTISLFRLWRRFKTALEKKLEKARLKKRQQQQRDLLQMGALTAVEE